MGELAQQFERATIERIVRDGKAIEPKSDTALQAGDVVGLSGRLKAVMSGGAVIGPEVESREALTFPMEIASAVITRKTIVGRTIAEIREQFGIRNLEGVYLVSLRRQGISLPVMDRTVTRRGDVWELSAAGSGERVAHDVGQPESSGGKTDLAFHALGIVAGMLIGLLAVSVGGISITLGMGGGVLVSGLCFGWLHARFPVFGALPQPAQWVLSEFGLSAFAAVIGL